jgi:hypothetical protein
MRVLSLLVAAVLGFSALSQAAPLESKHVCAKAKWVLHVDVDAVRASTVVQKAYHKCMEMHKEAAQHLDKVRDIIGMDLRKDLHGITAYGPQVGKHTGIVIVLADMDQKALVEKAKLGPDHKVTTYGSFELHSWTHKHGEKQHQATGVFFAPNVLVFGGKVEEVQGALDVLSGKAPSLAGKDSALVADIAPGTTFLFRATDVGATTKCPVLKQSQCFAVAMGEDKGESFFRAKVVMTSGEAAENLKAVVDGFKALGALRTANNAEAAKLVNALKVTKEDKTVVVQWSASADAVWAEIEKIGKKLAEWKAQGGKCPLLMHGGDKAKK